MKKLFFLNLMYILPCLFFISCGKDTALTEELNVKGLNTEARLRKPCENTAVQGTHYSVTSTPGSSNTQCCMVIQTIPAAAYTAITINYGNSASTTVVTNSAGQATYCGPFVYSYNIVIKKPNGNYCGTFESPCI
jgi:hypothetical protein